MLKRFGFHKRSSVVPVTYSIGRQEVELLNIIPREVEMSDEKKNEVEELVGQPETQTLQSYSSDHVPINAVLFAIDDWIHYRLSNTSVSHNTQIWNQLALALDDLKSRIQGLAK